MITILVVLCLINYFLQLIYACLFVNSMLSVVQEKQSLLKWSELRKSDKFRDSWALLYGHNIMGCTSALSALVLSFYGKHHFSISPLRSLIFTQFPALNLSLVSTMVLSAKAIDTSSLKFQYDRCDLCMYLKGALIHVSLIFCIFN